MVVANRTIFIHGLNGSSKGVKGTLLRGLYADMLIPDFTGSLEARMSKLHDLLGDDPDWTIIGSSFGGLMGAMFTCKRPAQVKKLILLAPALVWPDFAQNPPAPVDVPTIIYHGSDDKLIPLSMVKSLAEKVFLNLSFHTVDDDHGLYKTVHNLDWKSLLVE